MPKLLSGVDPIDRAWGGFYRGGSYLIYGRATSGRDLIPLRFLQVGASVGESGLVISPSRPKDLMIQSASIGFNLRQAYEQGTVRLMRIPPVLNPHEDDDNGILKAMHDLVAIIRQHRPQRLIINDFMPFVAFHSYDRLRTAFVEMLEQTDVLDMTMVLVMPQPANTQSSRVIDFMRSQMTGTIQVEMDTDHPESTERRLVLLPNIGHLQRQTVEPWDLQDIVEDTPSRAWSGNRRLPSSAPAPLPETSPRSIAAPAAPLTSPPQESDAAPPSFSPPTAVPVPSPPPPPPLIQAIPLGAARRGATGAASPPQAPPPTPTFRAPVPLGGARAQTPVPPPSRPSLDLSSQYISSSEAIPAPPPPPEPAQASWGTEASSFALPQPEPETRQAFAERLRPYFQRRAAGDAPFLLVAMRIPPDARQSPFDFETISDVVADTLRPQDILFTDVSEERLVAVLANTTPDQQRSFFAGVKSRLRENVPHHAEALLQAVSAFVAPNGQPFDTPESFLEYVLDAR